MPPLPPTNTPKPSALAPLAAQRPTRAKSVSQLSHASRLALFFETLGETSNVSKSAKKAKLSTSSLYKRRNADPAFARRWQDALSQGYHQLESLVLEDALACVTGKLSDEAVKSRALRHKLVLNVLNLHLKTVKGAATEAAPAPKAPSKADMVNRLKAARDRHNARKQRSAA